MTLHETLDLSTNGHAAGEATSRHSVPDSTPRVKPYFEFKPWLERPLALALLVLIAPFLGVLIAIIRLASRGPAIYSQVRTGRDGRAFTMYKLRTMRCDAEKYTGPIWSTIDDPRITWFGKLLRLVHLDELPQLVNVIRGEMAFVGPRPERPLIVEKLAREIDGYDDRHLVAPGITGLAQINLPPDTCVEMVRDKVRLDLEFIRSSSPWLEARILFCTLLRMLGVRHGRAVRLFGLERIPPRSQPTGQNGNRRPARIDGGQRQSFYGVPATEGREDRFSSAQDDELAAALSLEPNRNHPR